MPANMSFAHTKKQVRNRTKTVTRRRGWAKLKPGQLFWAAEKTRGLPRGQKVKRMALCRCVSNTPDCLNGPTLTEDDVRREGFPGWTPQQFIDHFRRKMGGPARQHIRRIEFTYESEQLA